MARKEPEGRSEIVRSTALQVTLKLRGIVAFVEAYDNPCIYSSNADSFRRKYY